MTTKFQYRRHYTTIETRGKARVVEDAAPAERPKGTPRSEWQDRRDNPFAVEGTGRYRISKRFPTRAAAEAAIRNAGPDEYETRAATRDAIETFLRDRGLAFTRDDAVTTSSTYYRVDGLPTIRSATHSRAAATGGTHRSQAAWQIDVTPGNKAQIASLLRSIDDYLRTR